MTARADAWLHAHPIAADTLLVVEVAGAGLAYDHDTKMRLYRQCGIANDWVVHVREPMAFFLLQGKSDASLLAALREPVEALVAELRAQPLAQGTITSACMGTWRPVAPKKWCSVKSTPMSPMRFAPM